MCGGHVGALLGAPLFGALSMTVTKYAAGLSAAVLIVPAIVSAMLTDSGSLI